MAPPRARYARTVTACSWHPVTACCAPVRRYVLCNSCKSPDTLLDRDSATRIMFLRCQQVRTLLPALGRSRAQGSSVF